MAFVYKHWDVDRDQVRRIEANPDSAVTPGDLAVLTYLQMPVEKRNYGLGRYALGRFEVSEGQSSNSLHTGSITGDDFEEVARGIVIEDAVNPDGLYEIYISVQ
jgi:hypothetical protein